MSAGYDNTTGSGNTFSGFAVGNQSDSGNNNIFIGYEAGYYMHNGNNDIFVGVRAGYDNTIGGSNDIYIGNQGTPLGTEDNTIRIGTQGTGQGEQDAAYIAGIYGKTTMAASVYDHPQPANSQCLRPLRSAASKSKCVTWATAPTS